MRDAAPQTIYLADYTPFGFVIDSVALHFDLDPHNTRVKSRIAFRPNPDATDRGFFLHGENLKLISAKIDGTEVHPEITPQGLTCPVPDAPFIWEAEVEIDPMGNTALEGLYMSNGMYCTQCEAEGFRKITYYPDRPDVMAVFNVTSTDRIRFFCRTATLWPRHTNTRNGTIPGPSPPICSPWLPAIWSPTPAVSPPNRTAR